MSDRLIKAIKEKKSPIVVGLDPRLESIPKEILERHFELYGETFEAAAESILAFNMGIIDAISDLVPAVKPQIAFYEQYGVEGMMAYKKTCEYAKSKGLVVVADVKRGDIGSTSKAYAIAHLGRTKVGSQYLTAFEADFATVNPYLGDDCMKEFMDEVRELEKGLFILVKTSNKTSGQIQDLEVEGEKVYSKVAKIVSTWNDQICGESGYSPIGAVVGATYPSELEALRKLMPKAIFLVPGYGAQGGTASDVVGAFNEDGLGAIVNSSRGIIFAYEGTEAHFAEAARAATIQMRDEINNALEKSGKIYW
ncbi:MAG TPA: orotidine-5'-phosphate decarboxylase [Clostridiales bacterium UBA8960]|nr:orotidine-5'-phosphate decarboxylase [Clostridiales bacterium UBA8960]